MSQPPTAEELGWWRELLAWIGSAAVAVASGAWIVGSRTREMQDRQDALEKEQQDHRARLAELEAQRHAVAQACREQHRAIFEDLRKEVCQTIMLAIKDAKIDSNREMATMTTALELHTQALKAIQADIEAIFARLNRRREDKFVTYGRRENDLD